MSAAAALEFLLGGVSRAVSVVLPGESTPRSVLVPAAGLQVSVADHLGAPVPVYADDTLGGAPLAQPLTVDARGSVPGFVAQPQRLFVTVGGGGVTSRTYEIGEDRDPVSITDVHVVASDAAMLAIADAHEGSVAVRTDLENRVFMHNGGSAGTDADWTQIGFGNVLSVNGRSGDVVLAAADVGADASGAAALARSAAIGVSLAIGG